MSDQTYRIRKDPSVKRTLFAGVLILAVAAIGIALVVDVARNVDKAPAAPSGPYWLTVTACEDATHQEEACVMYDENKWFWYPRGQIGHQEILSPDRVKPRTDALVDVNVGGLS